MDFRQLVVFGHLDIVLTDMSFARFCESLCGCCFLLVFDMQIVASGLEVFFNLTLLLCS